MTVKKKKKERKVKRSTRNNSLYSLVTTFLISLVYIPSVHAQGTLFSTDTSIPFIEFVISFIVALLILIGIIQLFKKKK